MGNILLRFVKCGLMPFALIFSVPSFGQHTLKLQAGNVEVPANFSSWQPSVADAVNGMIYRIVQFEETPVEAVRKRLEDKGIAFFRYLPDHAYICAIPVRLDRNQLTGFGIRSIILLQTEWKMSRLLIERPVPAWAELPGDRVAVNLQYYPNISEAKALQSLQNQNDFKVASTYPFNHQITMEMPISEVESLAGLPWVSYLETIDPPAAHDNLYGRTNHRSNVMATDYATGRHYDGTGVNVAMGDDGIIGPHIDYQGRADQSNVNGNNGDHGDHVAGTIMGAGNLDPRGRGMAFGATLHVYSVWDGVTESDISYVADSIRITSTSYSNGCNAGYTQFAESADALMVQNPSLMHVFSAGNDGTSNCGYGAGNTWGNVTGGVKVGKNVTTVANLNASDVLANSSSRGPTADGRIKPDVSAVGTSVYSTVDENDYALKSGTSMSCPGVSGTYAQLYHAYRSLNNGQDPNAALMKAVLMNTADDLGNPGPDFKFGYGRINGAGAVRCLEEQNYVEGVITQGSFQNHVINVPAGTRHMKVMLYWTDTEGSPQASVVLVNDLDMTILTPSLATVEPWILDNTPNAAALDAPAIQGVDHLNNTEQITIDDPQAGAYTVNINGFNIPFGPQTYFLVYSFYDDKIDLTYPIGGEGFVPGIGELLRWDAWGDTASFALDYSIDNGANWMSIDNSIAGSSRTYNWSVPNDVTGEALVRLSRNGQVDQSDTTFTIISVPTNLNIQWVCPDSLQLDWNPVTGAVGYEVSTLGAKYMDSIAYNADDSVVLYNTDPVAETWYSVRAVLPNGAKGQRAYAVQKQAGVFNCALTADAGIAELQSPQQGTYNGCGTHTSVPVTVLLVNDGVDTLNNIPLSYSLNGATAVQETWTGTLAPGASTPFTFATTLDLSSNQSYELEVLTFLFGDDNPFNDSASTTTQTTADNFTVMVPWSDDFESNTNCGTQNDCGGTNCLLDNWTNDPNGDVDDIDFRVDNNGTPSGDTGPEQDYNPGTNSGRYLFTEASGGCEGQVALLNSPCVDLTNAVTPRFEFRYHMYGLDMGELHVDVFSNGNWELDAVQHLFGNRGNVWRKLTVDLSPYVGEVVTIRFRGITGTGYRSDIAVDDVRIYDLVSTPEYASDHEINLYPNPANHQTMIEAKGPIQTINLYAITGQQVAEYRPESASNTYQIQTSELAPGTYLMEVWVNGQRNIKQLVIDHQ